LNNAEAVVSDWFQGIKKRFDLIVSNPPTHEKRELLKKFVLEATRRLEKNGRIVLVLNKAVFLEKELENAFGNCEILAEGKQHKVIEAVK
jgi:16S rRNA (guanine1207-N2)-methyltransferase